MWVLSFCWIRCLGFRGIFVLHGSLFDVRTLGVLLCLQMLHEYCFFVGHVRLSFPCRSCPCASEIADERPSIRLVEQVVAKMISIWPPNRPIPLGLAGNRVFSLPLNGFPPVLLRVPPRSVPACLLAIIMPRPTKFVKVFAKIFQK